MACLLGTLRRDLRAGAVLVGVARRPPGHWRGARRCQAVPGGAYLLAVLADFAYLFPRLDGRASPVFVLDRSHVVPQLDLNYLTWRNAGSGLRPSPPPTAPSVHRRPARAVAGRGRGVAAT